MLLIALVSSCLFLTACDSKEQKAQNAKWEKQATENAKAYITQKYGFSASVTEANVDRQQGMFGTTPLPDVFVQMQYDSRDFTVFITGEEESTEGADTYQAPEIRQALSDTIESQISGLQVLDIYPVRKSERTVKEPLCSLYFDGTNLSEVLKDGVSTFDAFYIRTDLSDAKDFSWLSGYRTTARFISCRDGDILKTDELTRNFAAPHPIYCDNIRTMSYSPDKQKMQADHNAYELQKYGDIYYYVNSEYYYNEGEASEDMPIIKEVDPPDPRQFNGRGSIEASVISKAYSISAESPMYVHVYYPERYLNTDKALRKNRHDFRLAQITKDKNGDEKYSAGPSTVVGDYVYERFFVKEDVPAVFEILLNP